MAKSLGLFFGCLFFSSKGFVFLRKEGALANKDPNHANGDGGIGHVENGGEDLASLFPEERHPLGHSDESFIRVAVKGGGCSGLMYELDFDTLLAEGDQVFEDNGVKVVVDRKSYLYLVGTELDFSGGLNGKGFVFINPNASRTCGCGESFSI